MEELAEGITAVCNSLPAKEGIHSDVYQGVTTYVVVGGSLTMNLKG